MEAAMSLAASGQSVPAVASLASALRVGEEVFREALQKAPALPKLADVGRAPATLAEAIQARDAKEEERRRREAVRKDVKVKGKQVTPLPAVVEQAAPAPTPGLHIGNVNDASAFWMFVEDYFRDVTQEDIMALMPVALNPEEDDCLTVPFLGRDPRAAVERPPAAKGKQAAVREDEDMFEQRRGRGRGAGKLAPDVRMNDTPAVPGGAGSQLILPQAPGLLPQVTADALVQGWRPDGRQAATMLDAVTDDEARSFCMLAQKLGILDDIDGAASSANQQQLTGPALNAMDRAQLEALMARIGNVGDAELDGGGRFHLAGDGPTAATPTPPAPSQAPPPTAAPAGAAVAFSSAAAADDDTQSSNVGGSGHELPQAACGDFMHPYLRSILERPCTAYVLNPCAGTGSLVESAQDDEEGTLAAGGCGKGSRGGAHAAFGGAGGYTAKTPGSGKAAAALKAHGGGGMAGYDSHTVTPMAPGGFDPNGAAMGGMHMASMDPQSQELPQLPPLPPSQHQGFDGAAVALGPGGCPTLNTPPYTGLPGAAGGTADKAAAAAAARGGRARTSVNYSALAGKKDKERERELREREKEERERAKSAIPKVKRKPGPKPGSSWSAGSAGAALAGLQRPPTNNPLALLNKAPLLFKDEPGSNAVSAAVHVVVNEGGPEGSLDEQWTLLDVAADIMSMAPDDEVLAELLALQSELVQQVAINRARVAAVMEAVIADFPQHRAANQQRSEMEEQIRVYLQRKAEVKRNLKREKREMEKRQALAALNEPASPRGMVGRPKKFASMPAMGAYEGLAAGGEAGPEAAGELWRGSTPGLSGGEAPPLELAPAAEDFELVDPLALRTHDEEALCAICGDGLSVEPNMIVFCERCDVAVHQNCYGVRNIPAEEWLCWPCRLYEEAQRAAGVPQSDIRPKRWEMEARGITHAELPGGSLAAGCCLCPVRQGAFKRTTDGKAWCHVVCGLWHEGPTVLPMDSPDVIENIGAIKPERWRSQCTICQRVAGAVVKCNYGHCQAYFHPLCARRAGNYLVARVQPGARTLRYRAYCHNHSEGQRLKDLQTGAAARPMDVFPAAAPVTSKPVKRGASMGALPVGSLLDGSEVAGAYGAGGAAGPSPMAALEEGQYGDPDAAAAAVAAPPMPVKKRFGRPPKILKQQQLLLQQQQQQQLLQAQQQAQQQQLAAAPAGVPPTHPELYPGLHSLASPAPTPGLPPPAHPPRQHQQQPFPNTAAAAAAAAAPPMHPGVDEAAAGGGLRGAEPVPTAPFQARDLQGGGLSVPGGSPATGLPPLAGPPGVGGSVGRPPLPSSRLSLAAMAKRKAAAAAAAAAAAGGPEGGSGGGPAAASGQLPPAGAGGTAAPAGEGPSGVGGMLAAAAGAPGATATAAQDAVGAVRARQSSSGASPGGGGGGATATATSSGPGKQQRLKAGMAVKEESVGEGEVGALVPLSPSAGAAAAAALARAQAAAAAAAANAPVGPDGRPATTLERLAEREHQKSMLGKWGPNSIRQELELLRTVADTVRRRERYKRSQYRLLRDAMSGASSQPEAVLSFFESWEWPAGDEGPFSPEDLSEPPPAVTALDRFLETHRAARAAGAPAGAAGPSGGGFGAGMKRQRGPGAGGAGADSAGAAVTSSSGGDGDGDGEEVWQHPAKRTRLKDRAAASAGAGAVRGGGHHRGARQGAGRATPSAGGGGGGGSVGVTSGEARSEEPSTMSEPGMGGLDGGAEVASRLMGGPGAGAGGGGKRGRGAGGGGGGKPSLKEVMSGRDWRRRVVMGPDGKWVPRPSPPGRGSKPGAGRGGGPSTSKASRDGGLAAGPGGTRGTAAAAASEREDADPDADEEVFEDAVEGSLEEGGQAEGKDDEDVTMTDPGRVDDCDGEGEEGGGNDVSGGADADAAGTGSSASSSGGGRDGGAGLADEGGEVKSRVAGRGGFGRRGGGGRRHSFPPDATPPGGGGDGSGGSHRPYAEATSADETAAAAAAVPQSGGQRADQQHPDQEPEAFGSAQSNEEEPAGWGTASAAAAGSTEESPGRGGIAGAAADRRGARGGGGGVGVGAAAAAAAQPAGQGAQGKGSRGEAAEEGSDGGGGGGDGAVSNGSRGVKGEKEEEEEHTNSDDAPIAALSLQRAPLELPPEPRAVMSQRMAEALNAKLPRGYRFEKEEA